MGGSSLEPLSFIWDGPSGKPRPWTGVPPYRVADFAEPRQAEVRCTFLNRGFTPSRPWLLQEAGGILSQDCAIPLESRELVPVLPS